MILTKDMLTKSVKKGRLQAEALLRDMARAANLPDPHYEYRASGSTKKRIHFFKVRYRVPKFILDRKSEYFFGEEHMIHGSGRATSKKDAKKLAALEVVHEMELLFNVGRNKLPSVLEDHMKLLKQEE